MSIRRTSTTTLYLCFAIVAALSTAQAAEAEKKPPPTSRPAKIGSVQKALKKLRVIPRSSINSTSSEKMPNKNNTSNEPNITSKSNRMGLQHRDAIRKSVSSVPINDDINAPVNKDMNAQIQEQAGAPLFFSTPYPDYYQHQEHGLSDRQRRRTNYRYFGGRPGRYGYGRHDYGDSYGGDVYRYGFMRGYNVGRFDQTGYAMQEDALRRHKIYLDRALTLFKQGEYYQAASTFKLAADSDQGDPASRIYAAHALFAIGRYRDAAAYLRLAFKLQPKIANLYYDMRDDYGNQADFDKQLATLEKAIQLAPNDINRLIVKGYIFYYTNQRDKAYEVLANAKKIDPNNNVINRLLDNCQPPDVIVDQIKNK